MLCSKRIVPPESSNPAPVHRTNSGNPPANTNQCPECGLKLKNQKGLKIHQSSKHQRKQNMPTSPGFWPYFSDARYDTCRQGLFSISVTSTNDGKLHNIKQPVTCKTKNVCYLITCKKCREQYTGETKLEFHLRMNNHNSDVRTNKKSTGMIRHFSSSCGVTYILPQPTILERVQSSDSFIRKAREQFYIELLGTDINAQ